MIAISRHHRMEVAIRYCWYKTKEFLRQNVNTDKNFFAADAAVRFSQGIIPQGTKVTCSGRGDGVGMQALARMSGINFARAFGATYVDTPFRRLDHAPGEMRAWVDEWEKLFNFGNGLDHISAAGNEVVDYPVYLAGGVALKPNTVLRFQQCYWLNRRYPDSFKQIAPLLQEKFGLSSGPIANRELAVAVHVRRGDVGAGKNSLRFTSNDYVLNSIICLKQLLQEMDLKFTIDLFSQGRPAEFAAFAEAGCRLNLDSDAVWTMRRLVEADVLVMAKSSFSYVAALINRGVKIYEPTFNPPLSDWVVKRRDGSFDRSLIRHNLLEYLGKMSSGAEAPAYADASSRAIPLPIGRPIR
jgi:hypothetical protein